MKHYYPLEGGILSPRDLRTLVWELKSEKIRDLNLGWRQDFWREEGTEIGAREGRIGSSLWLWDILPGTSWYNPGTVLEVIRNLPALPSGFRVELLDAGHTAHHPVPGDLRFVTWEKSHLWVLEFHKSGESWTWPMKVETQDIAVLTGNLLALYPWTTQEDFTRRAQSPVSPWAPGIPRALEGVEGWIRGPGRGRTLHIHRNSARYTLDFLQDLADLGTAGEIPRFALSPRGGITISGIPTEAEGAWNSVLADHSQTLFHGAESRVFFPLEDSPVLISRKQELEALLLGREIRCEGKLCLLTLSGENKTPPNPRYHPILRFQDDGSGEWDPGRGDLSPFGTLEEAVTFLFPPVPRTTTLVPIQEKKEELRSVSRIQRCQDCLGVYDPQVGDVTRGIAPGVEFQALGDDYLCACCGAPKSSFQSWSP